MRRKTREKRVSRIFISHSSRQNAEALALADWLTSQGWDDYFLDVTPHRGLAPGERWQEALRQATHRCEAVILMLSPAWCASRWCLTEYMLAKQLGKVILGVEIEPTPDELLPVDMSAEWQLCDLVQGERRVERTVHLDGVVERKTVSFSATGLDRLRHGLQKAGLDASTFPWPPDRDPGRLPYRGLRALDVDDAAVFFGREGSITAALDTLRRLHESGSERFLVILGASGSGKSSFLRAGLIPRLLRDDRHYTVLPPIRPGRRPITGPTGLLASLEEGFSRVGDVRTRGDLGAAVAERGLAPLLAELARAAQQRVGAEEPPPSIVLSVDQAEELYDAEAHDEPPRLRQWLGEVGRAPDVDAFVLFAIRSDSYESLQTDPRLGDVSSHLFDLPPVPRTAYRAIIEGPAERHTASGRSLRVHPALTEALLAEAEGADALPLLAFVLERLLVDHGADGELTLADYDAAGRIRGAIEAAIDDAFADPGRAPAIPADEETRHRHLRAGLLPWLARIDPDTEEPKRRVARWEEIPEGSRALLERLIERRLLVRDRRRVSGEAVETLVVEVAHEALLRQWPLLTGWLARDAEALKAIDIASRAAADWDRNGREVAWLDHTQERLQLVERFLERPDLDRLLGELGRVYVRACRARDDAALEAERERELALAEAQAEAEQERLRLAESQATSARRLSRRTLFGAGVAVVLMIAALAAAAFAIGEQRKQELALATSDATEAARRVDNGDGASALAFLARAVRTQPDRANWRGALLDAALHRRWHRLTVDFSAPEPVSLLRFSPTGDRVAIAAGDVARLYDPDTGKEVGARLAHRNLVLSVDFSDGGRWLATGSADRTIRTWSSEDGSPGPGPWSHDMRVRNVDFERHTGALVVRAVPTWGSRERRVIARHLLPVDAVDVPPRDFDAPGPARLRFRKAEQDGACWLVDDSGAPLGPSLRVGRRRDSRCDAGGSDDGRLAFVTTAAGAALVDVDTGATLWTSPRAGFWRWHAGPSTVIVWPEPYNYWRRGGSEADDAVHVLDRGTGEARLPPLAHPQVAGLALSSDERVLVTYGESGGAPSSFRFWDLSTGRLVKDRLRASRAWRCESDAHHIWLDGSVWFDIEDERIPARRLPAAVLDQEQPARFSFSEDCRHLAVLVDNEAHVVFIEAPVAAEPKERIVHAEPIAEATFSPDGTHLAVVGEQSARIFRLTSGRTEPRELTMDEPIVQWSLSDDATRLVTASATAIQAWDAVTGASLGVPLPVDAAPGHLKVRADGEQFVVEHADRVERWALGPEGPTLLEKRETTPRRGEWLDDESYFDDELALRASTFGKGASVRTLYDGERTGRLLRHHRRIHDLAFSSDGRYVATAASGGEARVWEAISGEPISDPLRQRRTVGRVAFSGDARRIVTTEAGRVASYSGEAIDLGGVTVWDVRAGAQVAESSSEEALALAVNRDGSLVVLGVGDNAYLWSPDTDETVGSPLFLGEDATAATFSRDETRVAVAGGKVLRLWDGELAIPLGKPHVLPGSTITEMRFVAGEQRLLVWTTRKRSWSDQGQLFLVDVPTGEAEDASWLAELAEVLGGYRLSEGGSLEPTPDRDERLPALVERADLSPTAAHVTSWLVEGSPVAELGLGGDPE